MNSRRKPAQVAIFGPDATRSTPKSILGAFMTKKRRLKFKFQLPEARPTSEAPALITRLVDAGARLRITPGGSLIVGGLGDLTPDLRAAYLDFAHPSELVRAARAHLLTIK